MTDDTKGMVSCDCHMMNINLKLMGSFKRLFFTGTIVHKTLIKSRDCHVVQGIGHTHLVDIELMLSIGNDAAIVSHDLHEGEGKGLLRLTLGCKNQIQ